MACLSRGKRRAALVGILVGNGLFFGVGRTERGGRLWWGKRQVKEKRKTLTGQMRMNRIWRIDGLDMQFVKSAKK